MKPRARPAHSAAGVRPDERECLRTVARLSNGLAPAGARPSKGSACRPNRGRRNVGDVRGRSRGRSVRPSVRRHAWSRGTHFRQKHGMPARLSKTGGLSRFWRDGGVRRAGRPSTPAPPQIWMRVNFVPSMLRLAMRPALVSTYPTTARCAVADALTKVALAAGPDAAATYRHFDATAHLFSQGIGWHTVGRLA